MKYDPTPLELSCIKVMVETRNRMNRERYAGPRPRPKWLGPGNVMDQEDLAQVRAVMRVVMETMK